MSTDETNPRKKRSLSKAGSASRGSQPRQYTYTEAAHMLQISAQTLADWVTAAAIEPLRAPYNHRVKLLTMEQLKTINKAHGRRETDILPGTPYAENPSARTQRSAPRTLAQSAASSEQIDRLHADIIDLQAIIIEQARQAIEGAKRHEELAQRVEELLAKQTTDKVIEE